MNFSVQPFAFALQLIALPTEHLNLPFQIRALPIGFGPLATQPINFGLLSLNLGDQIITRDRAPARLHALVMPRFSWKYKRRDCDDRVLRWRLVGYDPLNRYTQSCAWTSVVFHRFCDAYSAAVVNTATTFSS